MLSNTTPDSKHSIPDPHCFNMQELSSAVPERSRVRELILNANDDQPTNPLDHYLLSGLAYTIGSALGYEPPTRDECLAAFSVPNRVGLTAGARAWSKHSHRSQGEISLGSAADLSVPKNNKGRMKINMGWWGTPYGSVSSINARAMALFERVMDNSTWRNLHWLPHRVLVYEVRVEEGYGMRWCQDRSASEKEETTSELLWTFRGFVEPMMENGHEIGWKH